MALATAYLLGPEEEMLAGETTMLVPFGWDAVIRDCAVAVTARNVVIFSIDFLDGQPRWVTLAARATDVKIELRTRAFGFSPALMIISGNGRWAIRGSPRVFKPAPVLEARRQAAIGTVHIG